MNSNGVRYIRVSSLPHVVYKMRNQKLFLCVGIYNKKVAMCENFDDEMDILILLLLTVVAHVAVGRNVEYIIILYCVYVLTI